MFNPNIENSYPCAFCSHRGVCRFKGQFSEFYAKYAKEDNDASDKPECATIIINCKYKQQDTRTTLWRSAQYCETVSSPREINVSPSTGNPYTITASSNCSTKN